MSAITILAASISSYACGPLSRCEVKGPLFKYHFYQGDRVPSYSDRLMKENINLWRELTAISLSDDDIREGVYKMDFIDMREGLLTGKTSNRFIRWIYDNNASDLRRFLLLAKELEELRARRQSAWYYPSDKSGFDNNTYERERLLAIIKNCNKHRSGPLADRYALQAVRAYMTIGDFKKSIETYDRILAKYPDSNLFKRMAMGYIAGCYARLGDHTQADEVFASLGDFASLTRDDKLEYMASRNPESDLFKACLNQEIGYGDSAKNMRYYRLADMALKSKNIRHRGDWLYLKAYIEKWFNNDKKAALKYANQAMANSFSTPQMRDDARLFKICMSPYRDNSVADIKWMLQREIDGIWEVIIPDLLGRKELTKALLIANYNNKADSRGYDEENEYDEEEEEYDSYSWASLGFQMLLSCKADEVVKYKRELSNPTMELTKALRSHIRHDADYLNELIGTLYLREGRYEEAVRYLSAVSYEYQEQMNIYKQGYLAYDPWGYYYERSNNPWNYQSYKSSCPDYEYSIGFDPNVNYSAVRYLDNQMDAKLNFAKEMVRLESVMRSDKDSDKRGMATLRHAIGRYNSLNTCWAYTQYWLGWVWPYYYEEDGVYDAGNGEMVNYIISTPLELHGIDEWFEAEGLRALAMMSRPETLAEAHLILRNYRTIAAHYPTTSVGRFLATHCDSWADWL